MSKETKKKKQLQSCTQCGTSFPKELFKCPACSHWNMGGHSADPANDQTVLLSDESVAELNQIQTGPWDPCFGQQRSPKGKLIMGMVDVGVYLIGGAPGDGKSTLSLQLGRALVKATGREILYLEAEESTPELKARAVRLCIDCLHKIRVIPMGSTADLGDILTNRNPAGLIVDSLQGLCEDDLEAQVEFCHALKGYTVPGKFPAMVISHVTKDENFAGLMKLQHKVDATIMFTKYDDQVRGIKSMKSRFGPSGVERFFNMTEKGLVMRKPEEDDDDD